MQRSARSPRRRWTWAWKACAIAAAVGLGPIGCAGRARCNGVRCVASCPRDAAMNAHGRCACAPDETLVLGACVAAEVGDAFCGPAARMGVDGCAFRDCAPDEAVDLATGACVPRSVVARAGTFACPPGAIASAEGGQLSCLLPAATCPRGTDVALDVAERRCRRRPVCPAGSLALGHGSHEPGRTCVPVVASGGRTSGERVDVGAWAAIALGIDGADGSADLCRPIAQRPLAFGLAPDASLVVRVRVGLSIPDEDVSRVQADVKAQGGEGGRLLAAGDAVVSEAVGSAVEALRGLGGEASTGAVELEVRCAVGAGEAAGAARAPVTPTALTPMPR